MYFKEHLSSVYHDLLADLAHLEIPEEEWVDCMNCHACASPSFVRFNTKCCDYQASLINFITGSILNDTSDELTTGKQLIRNRIKNKLGITPYGILPSGLYNKAFQLSRDEPNTVTQETTTALKCSFLNEGNCTVYKYRSDMCGLHHCNSISVDHGLAFWREAKRTNLYLDKTLSLFIAKKMGVPPLPSVPKKLKSLSSLIETESGELDEKKYKHVWGDWYTKEEDFYKESARLFQSISKQELRSEMGQIFEDLQASLVSLAVRFNEHRVPDYLIFKEEKWQSSGSQKKLSPFILKYLRLFDGTVKTAEVVKKAAYLQIYLSETIQQFLEKGYLVERN